MGYMGFGIRKEDWSRKPKEAFKKAKDLYGNHLERLSKPAAPEGTVTTDFAELARLREQHKSRFHLGATITTVILAIGILTLFFLVYFTLING